MIDAECTRCGDQGPHPVTQDDGWSVTGFCRACFAYMHVVLYDVNTPVPEQAKD